MDLPDRHTVLSGRFFCFAPAVPVILILNSVKARAPTGLNYSGFAKKNQHRILRYLQKYCINICVNTGLNLINIISFVFRNNHQAALRKWNTKKPPEENFLKLYKI